MTYDVLTWDEPDGIAARGTLIVLGGRGEPAQLYRRFGARLAADAYKVRAIGDVTSDLPRARQLITALLTDDDLPAPKVLVGSDGGALLALRLGVHTELGVDGIVLAGLPAGGGQTPHDWDDELAVRTACPTHQSVLAREDVRRGALNAAIPEALAVVEPQHVGVPVLALHGGDDVVAPVDAALQIYRALPHVEIVVVDGGKHDALNDATHRTAAATVVLFLERLKHGAHLPVIAHRVA